MDRTCEYLVRTHMERNDKIIIFGDNVFSLKKVLTLTLTLIYDIFCTFLIIDPLTM